ncbi:hypothetical protein ACFYXC_37995 [Streptomyces sp. NPDC002701]|uniref:hypothetical protein n=1 Tax=Streptomyces sp. NPDC002701 TaxID=3364661 RepID=UPI0036CCD7D4
MNSVMERRVQTCHVPGRHLVHRPAHRDAWQRLSCGDGAKGPRIYDWAGAKLPANIIFDPDPPTHHRWVMRSAWLK